MIDKFGGSVESSDIHPSAKISETSYVSKEAVIGKDVLIEGYSSISGFVGDGTRIKDSVIMEGTKISKQCKIEASVIGRNNFIDSGFSTLVEEKDGKSIKVYVKGRYVNPTMKKLGLFTGENVTIKEGLKSFPGKMVFPNKTISQDIKKDKIIRAILFDADNTIYKTKDISKKADMAAMRLFLEKNPDKVSSAEKLYSSWKEIVSKIKDEKDPKKRTRKYSYGLLSKKERIIGKEKAFEAFKDKLTSELKLMEGFDKITKHLEGYKLAVMTEDTSDLTIPKLRNLGLDNLFDLIITSDTIGEMKPTPRYYKTIFKIFAVEPNECLVIGDNFEKDLEIAKEMGATTILFGKEDKRADYSIKNYIKLPEILGKI
jgi:putative hydrolase of the HAD superfamily